MALIVEDGTGLSTAEAYLSVADLKTYWTNRGVTLATDYADALLEAGLRKASAYIDTIARYKSIQKADGQRLEFPRDALVDWNGRTVSGVPNRVKDATAELAKKALTEELYVDLDRGGKIASESVGPISVSYAYDAPAGKTFRAAMMLLSPYVRDVTEQFAPFIGGIANLTSTITRPNALEPSFTLGMHGDDGGAE